MKHAGRQLYGGCRLGTESLEDQLERADAGSWQIAGRGANTPTSFALRNGSISTLSALFVPVRQHDIDGALVFKDGESRKQIPRPKKTPRRGRKQKSEHAAGGAERENSAGPENSTRALYRFL